MAIVVDFVIPQAVADTARNALKAAGNSDLDIDHDSLVTASILTNDGFMTLLGNFVWTRQGEGDRVEGKDHEEVLHEGGAQCRCTPNRSNPFPI